MNSTKAKMKFSNLDVITNKLIYVILGVQIVIALLSASAYIFWFNKNLKLVEDDLCPKDNPSCIVHHYIEGQRFQYMGAKDEEGKKNKSSFEEFIKILPISEARFLDFAKEE